MALSLLLPCRINSGAHSHRGWRKKSRDHGSEAPVRLMVLCCRRNYIDPEDRTTRYFPIEKIGNNWGNLVRRAQRLAFKRRCWAFLGRHLNLIKHRGKR